MPRGDKGSYTDRQKRKAGHIEASEKRSGRSAKTAERIAWATVNKQDGGGKKAGSGRGNGTRAGRPARTRSSQQTRKARTARKAATPRRSGSGRSTRPRTARTRGRPRTVRTVRTRA